MDGNEKEDLKTDSTNRVMKLITCAVCREFDAIEKKLFNKKPSTYEMSIKIRRRNLYQPPNETVRPLTVIKKYAKNPGKIKLPPIG
ncbi:MAG: hypothetical protein AAF600_14000 [Bacteroidota bacterium]